MELLKQAILIATSAHHGQEDKSGMPYIFHPMRVAYKVWEDTENEEAAAAAMLHDVLEDTEYAVEDLEDAGMPERVVDLVVALTRQGETYAEYIDRLIQSNDLELLRIKRADVTDNLRPGATESLSSKYHETLRKLYVPIMKLLAEKE